MTAVFWQKQIYILIWIFIFTAYSGVRQTKNSGWALHYKSVTRSLSSAVALPHSKCTNNYTWVLSFFCAWAQRQERQLTVRKGRKITVSSSTIIHLHNDVCEQRHKGNSSGLSARAGCWDPAVGGFRQGKEEAGLPFCEEAAHCFHLRLCATVTKPRQRWRSTSCASLTH